MRAHVKCALFRMTAIFEWLILYLKIVRGRARFDLRAAGGQAASCMLGRLLAMASLVDAILEAKTCDALREFLRNNGLHSSGKKAVLIQR